MVEYHAVCVVMFKLTVNSAKESFKPPLAGAVSVTMCCIRIMGEVRFSTLRAMMEKRHEKCDICLRVCITIIFVVVFSILLQTVWGSRINFLCTLSTNLYSLHECKNCCCGLTSFYSTFFLYSVFKKSYYQNVLKERSLKITWWNKFISMLPRWKLLPNLIMNKVS